MLTVFKVISNSIEVLLKVLVGVKWQQIAWDGGYQQHITHIKCSTQMQAITYFILELQVLSIKLFLSTTSQSY